MNTRYKENMREVLQLLENGRSLTAPQIVSMHSAGVTVRTVQRYIKEFMLYGLDLAGKGKGQAALPVTNYVTGLSRFFKAYFSERAYPPVHGDISEKLIADAIQDHKRPAQIMSEILRSIRDSRRLTFAYKPQHPDTRKKMSEAKARPGVGIVKDGYMPVTMVPRGFSFGGELLLVVGEAILPDGIRKRRQYAVRGMLNPMSGECENVQLTFDFSEIYADSVYTWIGGERYSLTIEDNRFDENPRVYELRANGEEEALAFASSALGRLRIINPPPALVKKASELGLDAVSLFKHTA